MEKRHAIELFGSQAELARALGTSRQVVWAWPEELEQAQADRVIGAAIRHGKLPGLIEQGLRSQKGCA
jgi:hypothetical protein